MKAAAESGAVGGLGARFLEVEGVRTRYYDEGAGDPVVLFHGGWFGQSSANIWSLNIPGIACSHRVIAADELGSGMSLDGGPDADDSLEARLRHMAAFLRQLNVNGAHLVGQSFGGYMATRLALEKPALARSLTIVDSATLAPAVGSIGERQARISHGLDEEADPRLAIRTAWQRLSFDGSHLTEELIEAQLWMQTQPAAVATRERWASGGHRRFYESMAAQKAETLGWLEAGRLAVPTLLHWGADDTTALLTQGRALFDMLAQSLPRLRMVTLNRAGHFHFREHPAEFNSNLEGFWATSFDSGRPPEYLSPSGE